MRYRIAKAAVAIRQRETAKVIHIHTHERTHQLTHTYGSQETMVDYNGEQVLIKVKYLRWVFVQNVNTPRSVAQEARQNGRFRCAGKSQTQRDTVA